MGVAVPSNALVHSENCRTDFAEAVDLLACGVVVIDAGGEVEFVNLEARTMLGCAARPASPLDDLLAVCGIRGGAKLRDAATGGESPKVALSDGRTIKLAMRNLPNGGAALTLHDVSSLVDEAERARLDPLTGLANRATLNAALGGWLRAGESLAVFSLDLDRFKFVNDTLGHQIGDALLRKVAQRLSGLGSGRDVVARVGGDEFVILRPDVAGGDDAAAFAQRIVDLIGRAYALEGHMVNVGASVGFALSGEHGTEPALLLKYADLALYCAKAEGRGRYRVFQPEMDARMQARRTIELELRRALALKEFELVYQPQIELGSNALVGFEALLRWNNAERGTISPAAFIPIAEETGLIVPIGEWVLRTACHAAASWDQPVSVAVNLSPLQFRSASLTTTVMSALASAGLEPHRLELEITEGALLDDTDEVIATLKRLRALGVRVSMDDFGTGYSSLSYLQKFPFDKIKIDQSFVRDMSSNEESSAIVRAIARLGASLGITTTAEGVETQEQLDAICAEGCTHVQGYLTGRPMKAGEAAARVAGPSVGAM
jgi:diguanylate cyclase (GGDEF)-like protein